jgi:sodium/pantothenate symporter
MKGVFVYQLALPTVLLLLLGFYGLTFLASTRIVQKKENVDSYMVSNNEVGFGMSAASMTATWIWAASFYAAASAGYKYGLSGALHYGFWGALMILFIYPFGKRFRQLAPKAHTLGEIMHARHGRSSQMILAGSNILGSCISLTVNFTAAGALVAILSPLSFVHGVLFAGFGVLSYTLWSGFRSSVLTDFGQLIAMILAAVIIIPMIFFQLGGPELFEQGMPRLAPEQASFYSPTAILEQGAPFFVAVLAYAIGNQTIAQRLFAVREDLIKPTFLTATVGYGAIVIGLGMLGLLALLAGIEPIDGDLNNLIPQMASSYLPPFMIGLLFIMVIGSLSSTADSDLSALSSIVMTDIYGKTLAKNKPNPTVMLRIGRLTMIVATTIGVIFASLKLDILTMLIFVGALWGSIVFRQPVLGSGHQQGLHLGSSFGVRNVPRHSLRAGPDGRPARCFLRTLRLDWRGGRDRTDDLRLLRSPRRHPLRHARRTATGSVRCGLPTRLHRSAQLPDRLWRQHDGLRGHQPAQSGALRL